MNKKEVLEIIKFIVFLMKRTTQLSYYTEEIEALFEEKDLLEIEWTKTALIQKLNQIREEFRGDKKK